MARTHNIGWETNVVSSVECSGLSTTGYTNHPVTGTTNVRSGAFAAQVKLTSASDNAFFVVFSSSHIQFVRVYIYVVTLPSANTTILEFNDGVVTESGIQMTTTGTLKLMYNNTSGVYTQQGSSSSSLSLNTWYQIELSINDTTISSTTINARLNGVSFASGTVAINASAGGVNGGDCTFGLDSSFSFTETASGEWWIDDIAINDGTGGNQNSFPGSGKLIRMTPNAAGDANTFASQVGGTAGSTNNFTRVDEVTPDGITSYNGDHTLNDTDMYKCNASGIGASDTVNVVQVLSSYAGASTSAVASIKLQIEKTASGTKGQSAAFTSTSTSFITTALAQSIVEYTNPDGAAWTQSTLDTMQIGMIVTTGNTNDLIVSTIWAYVDYTPSAGGTQYYSFLSALGVG